MKETRETTSTTKTKEAKKDSDPSSTKAMAPKMIDFVVDGMNDESLVVAVDTIDESNGKEDVLFQRIQKEARQIMHDEPEMASILYETVLAKENQSFEDVIISTLCYRLLILNNNNNNQPQQGSSQPFSSPDALKALMRDAMNSTMLEYGHTINKAIREDTIAVCNRDPAMSTILEVVIFSKGYAALVCHRIAYRLYKERNRKFTAYLLQSMASATFGLDIHPCTTIGVGMMFDHGTGVVLGETATVGDGCTILHGVTLGGTGKELGDRHPKVGDHVLIGANVSVLGNITIGSYVKIGAGSVVLRPIPHHATAVGVPAKIIGRVTESDPGAGVDSSLMDVNRFHVATTKRSNSSITGATITTGASTSSSLSLEEDKNPRTDGHDDRETENKEDDTSISTFGDGTSTTGRDGDGDEDDVNVAPAAATTSNSNNKILKRISSSAFMKNETTDDLCPFRGLRELAKMAPKGTITICTLFRLFKSLGAISCSLGASFFELDTKGVGHVHWVQHGYDDSFHSAGHGVNDADAFLNHMKEVVSEHTGLDETLVEKILKEEREHVFKQYGEQIKNATCCGGGGRHGHHHRRNVNEASAGESHGNGKNNSVLFRRSIEPTDAARTTTIHEVARGLEGIAAS